MIQTGMIAVTTNGTAFTFPEPFSEVPDVSIWSAGVSVATPPSILDGTLTATGFTLVANVHTTYCWLAIGPA